MRELEALRVEELEIRLGDIEKEKERLENFKQEWLKDLVKEKETDKRDSILYELEETEAELGELEDERLEIEEELEELGER